MVGDPGKAVELRPEVRLGQVGGVEQDRMVELAPADLGQELLDLAGGGVAGFDRVARGDPDLAGTDFAEVQVRR
ncbi:hypothetical protein D3C86_2219570 [compost metagenome]